MMLFEVGDEVRVRQPTNLFHSELGKVVSIDHVKLTYKVVFHRGNSDVYTCFDLILVKRQEETGMKFKVGDKVKVSDSWRGNSGKVGTISRTGWGVMYKYRVEFEDAAAESFKEEELELVKEDETSMKFKVGDKVKVSNSWEDRSGEVGEIIGADDRYKFKYTVAFNDGFAESFKEEELELVKEDETSMKFKVGDKVKVSNSWFGFTDEVGVIASVEDQEPEFKYTVKFNVEDGETKEESFREEELELVSEKQSFTKSDRKTGMGVVLRNGDKAHVLLGTDDGDVMRFLEKDTWDTLESANEDLTWKGMDNFDIVEVYSTTLASRYLTDMVFEAKCVFKREEPKPEPKPEPTKMTMKEINEHFGKPIEIVE